MNYVNEYNYILNLDNKSMNRKDKCISYLAKAKLEFFYKDIGLATKSLEIALENMVICNDIFSELVTLSILLNRLEQLYEICLSEEGRLEFLDQNIYVNELFINYYRWKRYNEHIDIESLSLKCRDNVEKSDFFYILSLSAPKDLIDEYLDMSYKMNKYNLSVIDWMFRRNRPLDSNNLKNLFENQPQYFKKAEFHKTKEKKFDFDFLPLGGGDDIGSNSYFLRIGKYKILIDFGIKLDKKRNKYPDFDFLEKICPLEKLDMIILTHAHLDHCGALIELYKRNSKIKVIMTKETRELVKINMRGSLKDLDDQYLLAECLKRSIGVSLREPLNFFNGDLVLELFRAGHILGAASVLLKGKDCTVFFTGDYCLKDQHTVLGMDIPKEYDIDILITENTYGNKNASHISNSREFECEKLTSYVINKINEGKKILIPSFAIGRAQELICILKEQASRHNFRIYVDGLAVEVTELYKKYIDTNMRGHNVLYIKNLVYDNKEDFIEEEVMNNRSCIITSSGMLQEGSTAVTYAKKILADQNGVCILTGYQADDTLGAKLKSQIDIDDTSEKYIQIEEKTYKVKSELKEFNLSAHCTNYEILALAALIKPKKVILIHGDAKENESCIHKTLSENSNLEIYQSRNNEFIQF